MDATKLSFLKAVLGDEGAQALNKAVERYEPLESVLIPRAILSWLSLAARTGFEGEIPGFPGSNLTFSKNSADLFAGLLSVNGNVYPFENASFMHVVAGVSVALNADLSADHGIKDSDLVNLGRQVDLLTKSEFVNSFEPLEKGAMQTKAPFNPRNVNPQERGAALDWQFIGDRADREAIPAASPELKARALHRISGYTKVKQDAHTGERHFLLHRVMGPEEHAATVQNGAYLNNSQRSSWTPKYDWASGKHGKSWGSHIVSAWVPEGNIHHAPWMLGDISRHGHVGPPTTPNQYRYESEIVVDQANGRSFPLHAGPMDAPPVGSRGPANERLAHQRSETALNNEIDSAMALFGKSESTVKPKKKKIKTFEFKKSQLTLACAQCGCPQVDGNSFKGCMCTTELARFAKLSKTDDVYTIEFGSEWGEDELSLLFSITGEAHG